jgi:hypothetical protein
MPASTNCALRCCQARSPAEPGASPSAPHSASPTVLPDRFLVGLAVLNLLSDIGEERRSCAWWTTFVAGSSVGACARLRRAAHRTQAVLLLLRHDVDEAAARRPRCSRSRAFADRRARCSGRVQAPLGGRVVARIVAETRGNPSPDQKLPWLDAAQLAGGFRLPAVRPLAGRIEEAFRRVETLPDDARRCCWSPWPLGPA